MEINSIVSCFTTCYQSVVQFELKITATRKSHGNRATSKDIVDYMKQIITTNTLISTYFLLIIIKQSDSCLAFLLLNNSHSF